jgi:hypothetical protein
LERPSLSFSEIFLLSLLTLTFLGIQFFLLKEGLRLIQVILFLALSVFGSIFWIITAALHSSGSTARVMALSIALFILFSGSLQKFFYFLSPNIRLYQISALANLVGYMSLLYGISKMISVRWFAATGRKSVKVLLVFLPLFMLYLAQQSPMLLSYVAFDLICFFLASISVLLFPKGLPNDVLASIQVAALPSMISDFIRYGEKTFALFTFLKLFEEIIASFSFTLLTFLALFYFKKVRGLKEVIELAETG